MTKIFKCDKQNVCFIGDIHGEFNHLYGLMKHNGLQDTVYIICGDCGFGFYKKEYYSKVFDKLTRFASKNNCEFLFVRGNHDSKKWFEKQMIHRKCFKTVPDYSVIQTAKHNILCIGGAISIDRTFRKSVLEKNILDYAKYHNCSLKEANKLCPQLYWEDEPCCFDEKALEELKLNNIKIDIVCTHTCPSFCKPLTKDGIKGWLRLDESLENDINKERNVMDKIYCKLKQEEHAINKWFYGHFHFHNSEYIEGTNFIMLDMYRNGNFDSYIVKET